MPQAGDMNVKIKHDFSLFSLGKGQFLLLFWGGGTLYVR